MNYTPIQLFIIGLVGVLFHNLIELNKLNRAQKGNFSIKDYFKMEIYTISISVLMSGVSAFLSTDIKQLKVIIDSEYGGLMVGGAFIAIGYMGQSILVAAMGKANKFVNKENEEARAKADQV